MSDKYFGVYDDIHHFYHAAKGTRNGGLLPRVFFRFGAASINAKIQALRDTVLNSGM
jgi:hypothetical protein